MIIIGNEPETTETLAAKDRYLQSMAHEISVNTSTVQFFGVMLGALIGYTAFSKFLSHSWTGLVFAMSLFLNVIWIFLAIDQLIARTSNQRKIFWKQGQLTRLLASTPKKNKSLYENRDLDAGTLIDEIAKLSSVDNDYAKMFSRYFKLASLFFVVNLGVLLGFLIAF